jgi:hypothetical protein
LQGGVGSHTELGGFLERPTLGDWNDAIFCFRDDVFRERAICGGSWNRAQREDNILLGRRLTAGCETANTLPHGPHTRRDIRAEFFNRAREIVSENATVFARFEDTRG